MSYSLYDHILGSLTAAGIGDAIGAPSEAMSPTEIVEKYGSRITTFIDGSTNIYAFGNFVGEITDDTSQMYEIAKAIIKTNGALTVDAVAEAIINWTKDFPRYYPRNCGPTTRYVIKDLQDGKDPVEVGMIGLEYNRGTSNGAAMRVAPTGLICPGDWRKAAENAIINCRPSHGTQHAFAGACALACGISEAITENTQLSKVIRACLYGAEYGNRVGLETARCASGIDTRTQILRAVNIAFDCTNIEKAEAELDKYIGTDGSMQNSIATSIGLFVAADGDAVKTVISAANIGGDTDTIGCMAGSLAGAYCGYSAIPNDLIEIFENVNSELNFKSIAQELVSIAEK